MTKIRNVFELENSAGAELEVAIDEHGYLTFTITNHEGRGIEPLIAEFTFDEHQVNPFREWIKNEKIKTTTLMPQRQSDK